MAMSLRYNTTVATSSLAPLANSLISIAVGGSAVQVRYMTALRSSVYTVLVMCMACIVCAMFDAIFGAIFDA